MAPSSTPPTFVIGDIHGCAHELRELLGLLPIVPEATVVFIGDYIDRGEASREVIDAIIELKSRCNVVPLLGNHEDMLLRFMEEPSSRDAAMFIFNGGGSTLATYADEHGVYSLPDDHAEFYRTLPLWHQDNDYVYVHASLPPVPIEEVDPIIHRREMLWARKEFLRSDYHWEKIVVHGHTPVHAVEIRSNRINVDTGCVFGRDLSAIEFPARRIYRVPRQSAERIFLHDVDSKRKTVRFDGSVPVTLDYRGKEYHCETINYSELGMLLRDDSDGVRIELRTGEAVTGTIGDEMPVTFKGRVVRVRRHFDANYFALAIQISS